MKLWFAHVLVYMYVVIREIVFSSHLDPSFRGLSISIHFTSSVQTFTDIVSSQIHSGFEKQLNPVILSDPDFSYGYPIADSRLIILWSRINNSPHSQLSNYKFSDEYKTTPQ